MPDTATQEAVLFEEVQQVSPATTVFTFLAGGGALVGGALFAAARGELHQALPGLAIGGVIIAAVGLLIAATRLRSRVTLREATFEFGRFGRVRLRASDVASVEMARFGLFSGGIGYHIGLKSVAITARTGDGVRIGRADGGRVLVGTQHPEALYSALLRLQSAARPGF